MLLNNIENSLAYSRRIFVNHAWAASLKQGCPDPILKPKKLGVLIFDSEFLLFHVKLCKFIWIHWSCYYL